MLNNPARLFLALCLASAAGLGWYYWRTATGAAEPKRGVTPSQPEIAQPRQAAEQRAIPAAPRAQPPVQAVGPAVNLIPAEKGFQRIFFRRMNVNEHYGQLAYVEPAAMETPEFVPNLFCEVVSYASGRGVCLKAERGVFTRYTAELFDAHFNKLASLPLNGVPSRTRVSPDGKLAAVTVFITGHSYSSVDFTTQTLLLDAVNGTVLSDLEQFAVTNQGQAFKKEDFNFWGVTFAPDNKRFYSTLSTSGQHYLIEGDPLTRTARVIRAGVECPSVSPDGKRVAYKSRMPGNRVKWRLHVLDLSTLAESALVETRNVDDQLEWLDNSHVLYALPENANDSGARVDVWVVPIDGNHAPRMLLPMAYSPSVVR